MSPAKREGFFRRLFKRFDKSKDEEAPEAETEAPAPEPEVVTEPEPAAKVAPEPEPEPSAPAQPEPVEAAPSEPEPGPADKPAPKPKPKPKAKPAPKAKTKAKPKPKAEDAPEPAIAAEPEPEAPPEPVPAPQPEAVPAPEAAEKVPAPVLEPEPEKIEPEAETPAADEPAEPKRGWFTRLKDGLSRSSRSISTGLTDIFTKRKLDAEALEDLEDILIQADLGVDMAMTITEALAKGRYDKEVSPDEVKKVLAEEIAKVLEPVAQPLSFGSGEQPFVILVVGVNGTGKTTTIGKLAAIADREGFKVTMAACDTFRAAAIDQLKIWGERVGADVVTAEQGADASGLAYDAFASARQAGSDILLIDTAGRLQNKAGLMAELEKLVRVLKKHDAAAPHAVLLVLDATTGQNAISQAEIFQKIAGVTGIIMTKLDGTARGGILVAIARKFALPVHAIGVGETIEDLQPFDPHAFAEAIVGLEEDELD